MLKKKLYTKEYGENMIKIGGYSEFRNNYRIKKLLPIINARKDEQILEIGFNNGDFIKNVEKQTKNIFGIDINRDIVAKLNKPSLIYGSATAIPFSANHFDKVYAFEVIEHIKDIKKVFSEVNRILKPKGKFIFSFPFEILGGEQAIIDAIKTYKNIFYASKLHVHVLNPQKIKKIIHPLKFKTIFSKLLFIPSPSFVMIIQKIVKPKS